MVLAQPARHAVAEPARQLLHPTGVDVGHHADTFVSADVALLAVRVERGHELRIGDEADVEPPRC